LAPPWLAAGRVQAADRLARLRQWMWVTLALGLCIIGVFYPVR